MLQAAESFGSAPGKSLSTSFRDCGLLTCFPQTEPPSSVSAGQSPGRGKAQGSFVWICPASLSCIEKYRQPNNGGVSLWDFQVSFTAWAATQHGAIPKAWPEPLGLVAVLDGGCHPNLPACFCNSVQL